jgi:ABC-2 type transport system permease protein
VSGGDDTTRRVRATMAFQFASVTRIAALINRYLFLLWSSWPRLLGLIYWPAVQMLTWGFLQLYFRQASAGQGQTTVVLAAGTLIGSMLLWDILFRGQLGFSITFLEEMYARNIGNLLMSPLRPVEFVVALMVMSLIRLAIGVVPVSLLAIAFFGFNLWNLGAILVVFFCNLIFTSWAVGLFVSGLVLRNGLGAEELAWSMVFLMMPLACVYYPVTVLPVWLQPVAWFLPPTYVFEGLRAILIDRQIRLDLMLEAMAINVVLLVVGAIAFRALLDSARRAGSLLAMGE